MRKRYLMVILLLLAVHFYNLTGLSVYAFNPMDVVVNEVSWAGTAANSNHEWIELYNNTGQEIDLSDWEIIDDSDTTYSIESGVIAPYSYFIIEDTEEALESLADSLISISLSNTGDSLVLKDNLGNAIDIVNSSGAQWAAGDSTNKISMERIDPQEDGDVENNWASSVSISSVEDFDGNSILGSPGEINSVFIATSNILEISPKDNFVEYNDLITFTFSISEAEEVLGYGINLTYDPTVLNFVEAQEGDFLSSDGQTTSFLASLKDSLEGELILAGARLGIDSSAKSGAGSLFTVTFKAVGVEGASSNLDIASNSFISGINSDLVFGKDSTSTTIGSPTLAAVENLEISESEENYSLKLSWIDPENSADRFLISKKDQLGNWLYLGETSELEFVDSSEIVPQIIYEYKVVAEKSGIFSPETLIEGSESRGINGDINRDSIVDGRDLIELAKHYSASFSEEAYSSLVDINYDGNIDGQDLISLAANFAVSI